MPNNNDECRNARREMLTRHLDPDSRRELSAGTATHAAGCPGCRAFGGYLAGQGSPFPAAGLYTANLRAHTLRAVREKVRQRKFRFLLVLGPAALASLAVSVALPLWLMNRLFANWLTDPFVSLFLAVTVCYLTGITATTATIVPLLGKLGPRAAVHAG